MPWHPLPAAQVTIAFMPREYPQPFTQPIAPQAQVLGLGLYDYHRLDRAMASRRSAYDYLRPSFLGDALIQGTWLVASDGKLTMERRFQLICGRVYMPALPAPLANALPQPS